MFLVNKASPICNRMINRWVVAFTLNTIFNHPNSQENYKMLIRIIHSFLNRGISILDFNYNKNSTDSYIVLSLFYIIAV